MVVGYSLDESYLHRQVENQQRQVIPAERKIQLKLHRVGQSPAIHYGKVEYYTVLNPPLSAWALSTVHTAQDPLMMLEAQGRLKRLGLLAGLILVLLTGLVLTYQGVRRESELARLKSDFASNVSHELKTPLTSIRMYAEMLQQGIAATAADRDRYHTVIIKESERLGRLIANVLDFSKVERGTRRYNLASEDVKSVIDEAIETFCHLSEGGKVDIQFSPSVQTPPLVVVADREAAVQSVLNLLSNAAKYSPEGSPISIALKRAHGEVGVEISDQGIGIAPMEQKRIFDDFYRAPDARRIGVEGTGLGLALVRRHMKACGGRVELHSAPAQGSRFTLWFNEARMPPEKRSDEQIDDSHY
jgi:signal transduction histidine kinase